MPRSAAHRQRPFNPEPPPRHFERHVPGIEYEVLEELVGYSIRRAQIVFYEIFDRMLAPIRVTTQRFSSLVIVEQNPGLTQMQLADVLGVARSGVMLLVDFHESEGFVVREPSPTDRRAYGLRITPKGRRYLAEAKRLVREADRLATLALSAPEREQLKALLEKIGEAAVDAPKPAAKRRSEEAPPPEAD